MLQRVLITRRGKRNRKILQKKNNYSKATLSGLHPILSLLFLLLDFSSFTSLYFPSLGKMEVPSAKGSTKKDIKYDIYRCRVGTESEHG